MTHVNGRRIYLSGPMTGMDASEVMATVAFIVVLLAVMLVLGAVM